MSRKIVHRDSNAAEHQEGRLVDFEDDPVWHKAVYVDTVGNFVLIDYNGLCYCYPKEKYPPEPFDKAQREGLKTFKTHDEAREYAAVEAAAESQ